MRKIFFSALLTVYFLNAAAINAETKSSPSGLDAEVTETSPVGSNRANAKSDSRARMNEGQSKVWKEDTDGVLEANEYRAITEDGLVTRRPCPYTCEDRGIARSNCKEWRSKDENACYVQDTSKPQRSPVVH